MSGMNFKKTLLALLLTLTLLFTLTLPAFATDAVDAGTTADATESVEEPAGSDADGETTAEAGASTTTGSASTTTGSASTTTGSSSTTTGSSTTTAATDDGGMGVGDWISLGIGAVILLVILVMAILFITAKDDPEVGKNGEKVPFAIRGKRFFRSCKSEAKKVVWTPAKTVRKNTIVVIIVIIVCAIVIGLLDWVFSRGFNALAGLF